jgi:hypothetical protein
MRKSIALSLLVVTLAVAVACQAQPSNSLDDVLAEVVGSEIPKWKQWRAGAPFTGNYATTTSKTMFGEWVNGKHVLSLNVSLADGPEEMDSGFRSFFIRSVLPQSGKVTGLGEKAAMLSTCTFVDIIFAQYNVVVKLNYTFRRGCDRPVTDWSVAAPTKEIERATKLAHALYAAIDSDRSMTPCRNDFLNTFFPRPTNDRERMLEAAFNGNAEVIRSLVTAGVQVSGTDKDGNTPLHLAVRHGCRDAIKALIEAKADVNARNLDGRTPLMTAANLRNLEAVQSLTDAGASPQLKDKVGWNAADHASERRFFGTIFPQPEHNGPEVLKLLEAHGVHPRVKT